MLPIIGILHNAKYAFGHNPLSFSGQRKVRLGEVRKNANFALTMPFVRYENAIYADNANCANQNANYDDNAICACFPMLSMHWVHNWHCRTFGIVNGIV